MGWLFLIIVVLGIWALHTARKVEVLEYRVKELEELVKEQRIYDGEIIDNDD